MSMDQHLAAMFGTDKLASQRQEEEMKLAAAVDHFTKVATAAGLSFGSDQEAANWFDAWNLFQKTAYDNNIQLHQYNVHNQAQAFVDWVNRSYGSPEQKVAQEASRFISKIANEASSVEAQFEAATQFGKIAAHAYVNTLTGLMKHGNEGGEAAAQAAQAAADAANAASGADAADAANAASGASAAAENKGRWQRTKDRAKEMWGSVKKSPGDLWDYAKKNPYKATGMGVGTAAALAALAYGGKKIYDKKKGVSEERDSGKDSFDQAAAEKAHELLVSQGHDGKTAAERLIHVLRMEAFEPTSMQVKMAAAQSPEAALLTRAAELLELAGYEIR